jgi:hydrogenase maturation protease
VNTALIGGIGNVLLGDDGIGPYVVQLLLARYSFGDDVEVVDLGTPALDLTHRIVGRHALILVDSVAGDAAPGTIALYCKEDILRTAPAQRLDPHSPALSECLLAAEMLGAAPQNVLLVGIVGESYEPGHPFSDGILQAAEDAVDAVLAELTRLGFSYEKKAIPEEPGIWWAAVPEPPSRAAA